MVSRLVMLIVLTSMVVLVVGFIVEMASGFTCFMVKTNLASG